MSEDLPDRPGTVAAAAAAGDGIAAFIARWRSSGAAERANYQLFLTELCDVLGVPRPEPAQPDDTLNAYVFERAVTFDNRDGSTSTGRIDLYKRGCFVLEAKQGADTPAAPIVPPVEPRRVKQGAARRGTARWDDAMLRARGQAEQYVRALPASEGNPPFVIVVDVGHTVELYADFSRSGKAYLPFPDARSHRLGLADLEREEVRERLRAVWTDPAALDPARRAARVTREVASHLAALARSLEAAGHDPQAAAQFLMRCLFTMFAEDVGLLPRRSFTGLLAELRAEPEKFAPMAHSLWSTMHLGGFSPVLREWLPHFNGGLFESAEALPLSTEQLALLIEAARCEWRDVEPAIFGTLLERALDPRERHALGAHYTPRAYVERLVMPTIVEPLRDEWQAALAAAVTLARAGKAKRAADEVKAFLKRLCAVRILDPACGSGNFLYVALEHLKRLEGEVLDALASFDSQALLELSSQTVDPHQLLGLEINPRAAAITELVLWIGFLQWHFRSRGGAPPEPILKAFRNVECRDAVLAYDWPPQQRRDENGAPVSRWDGRTFKPHPVTGKPVPDETAQAPVWEYPNAHAAEWPEADFIVGNPPYIGNKRMRQELGDGYVEALRAAHPDVPKTADYVMYWWDYAAELARAGAIRRFGFITTNSITQTFNRKIVQRHIEAEPPLSIVFAVPDHPWVDSADGAAVRVAMTTASVGPRIGALSTVTRENPGDNGEVLATLAVDLGRLNANLTLGPPVHAAVPLRANAGLCTQGVKLVGDGFVVSNSDRGPVGGADNGVVKSYVSNRDLVQRPSGRRVIDFHGLSESEAQRCFPAAFQRVYDWVRPLRMQNRDPQRRRNWWLFGRTNERMRAGIADLQRFIVTPEVAKHRPFAFVPGLTVPDASLYVVASDDAFVLGVLSSSAHAVWALSAGGTLEDRPRYHNTTCFEPFPFPPCTSAEQAEIRALGDQLDAHRKRRQAAHPGLTLTGMYNVLEKLRSGEALTAKERVIHEQGLVSVLKQIHDELDAAVAAAYGWPADVPDEEILSRLVALNAERAAEEARGLVRWLRPEFQNPAGGRDAVQVDLELPPDEPAAAAATPRPWPQDLAAQAGAVRDALAASAGPATAAELAQHFTTPRPARIASILATLVTLGHAREAAPGTFVPAS